MVSTNRLIGPSYCVVALIDGEHNDVADHSLHITLSIGKIAGTVSFTKCQPVGTYGKFILGLTSAFFNNDSFFEAGIGKIVNKQGDFVYLVGYDLTIVIESDYRFRSRIMLRNEFNFNIIIL